MPYDFKKQLAIGESGEEFPNAWESWTAEGKGKLVSLFSECQTIAAMSENLMRSRGAVTSRLRKLEMTD
jgi:hypothetical protein